MAHGSKASPNNDRTPPAEVPLSTLRALEEQTTPELMNELRQYAQGRAKLVRRAGTPVSATYARDLIDDAHADTRIGQLPWDPRCRLVDHLKAAIKKRTWLEIRHARRVTLVSLQDAVNDEAMSPQVESALAYLQQRGCNPIMLCAMMATVCQQLRARAVRDVDAVDIVKCWAAGVIEKDEVMRLTGLTEVAYVGARRRLRDAIRGLTSELREAAQDMLRSAA